MNQAQYQLADARMINWARWALSDGSIRHRCASAEGQYRPVAVDDDKHEYARAGVIDSVEAELIEAIVCGLQTPVRVFFRLFYVQRSPNAFIARKLCVRPDALEEVRRRNLEEVTRLFLQRKEQSSRTINGVACIYSNSGL